MTSAVSILRQNPEFRALSVSDQVRLARRARENELAQTPEFRSLPRLSQDKILDALALDATTFDDPSTEAKVKSFTEAYMRGDAGAQKKATDFWQSTVNNSGILGFVDQYIIGGGSPTRGSDRKRALEYYRELDRVSGRSDIAQEAGAIAGVIADVIGVNVVMSPAVGAAKSAISVAAHGGKAMAALAKSSGVAAPLLKRGLVTFGPVAAESLIEAVPYLLVEEQRRLQQGQPSVFDGGALEIAKNVGMNAALDFAAGSVLLSALSGAGKLGKAVFRKKDMYREAADAVASLEVMRHRIRTGLVAPEILEQLPEVERALVRQREAISRYIRDGLVEPDSWNFARDSYLAHDLKRILERTDDVQRPYRVFEFDADLRPKARDFNTLRDAEDYLAYTYYKSQEDIAQKLIKEKGVTLAEALVDPSITNPQHVWAIQRGKLLRDQMAVLDPKFITEPDAVLSAGLRDTPAWYKSARNRPVITRSEANNVVMQEGVTGVLTQLDVSGEVVRVVNETSPKQAFDLMRGKAPFLAKTHDAPNALIYGVSQAPSEAYELATSEAARVFRDSGYKSMEEARAAILLNKGFDHFVLPDASVEFFTTRNLKLVGTVDDIVAPLNKGVRAGPIATASVIADERRVLLKTRALQKNPDLVLESAVTSLRSRDPDKIGAFARMYLQSAGVSTPQVKVRFVNKAAEVGASVGDGVTELRVLKSPLSFANEKKQIMGVLDGLNDLVNRTPGLGDAVQPSPFYLNKLNANPMRFGFPAGVDATSWVESSIARLGATNIAKADGGWLIDLPSGQQFIQGEGLDSVVSWLAPKLMDESAVINDLLTQGVRVTKNSKTGVLLARSLQSGELLAEGSDLQRIMQKLDYTPSKLDLAYGTKDIAITPEGIEFTLGSAKFVKDRKAALATIGKFEDQKLLAQRHMIKQTAKGDLSLLPDGKYRVYNRHLETVKNFDNAMDARRFFEADMAKLSDLEEIANRKFLDFYVDKGQYVLSDSMGNVHRLNDYDSLAAKLREYPDISESVPELINLDPEVAASLPDLIREFKVRTWTGKANPLLRRVPELPEFTHIQDPVQLNWLKKAQQATSDVFGWIDSVSAKHNVPYLAKFKTDTTLGLRRVRSEMAEIGAYAKEAFRGSDGTILSLDSRRRIFYALGAEAGTPEAGRLGDIYKVRTGKVLSELTTDELAAAKKLKEVYEDLSLKFGIDYRKLIHDYMPRIREKMPSDLSILMENPDLAGALKRFMPEWADGKMPKEIKFFAENARTMDLPDYFLKDDALEVLLMYSAQGHKKLILNPIFAEAKRFFTEAGNSIDPSIGRRLAIFESDIMGTNLTNGERILADFGSTFMRNLKQSSLGKLLPGDVAAWEDAGRNTLNNILGLTYFSSMGFKPWLAIRNTFQTDTMLAMRVGVDWTYRGKKAVLDNLDHWVRRGFEQGILSDKPPIVNLVFSQQGKVGKLSEKAFQMFKNSDDYTRLVAFAAGEMRADNAIRAFRLDRTMSKSKLLEMAGVDRFNPELGERFYDLVQRGLKEVDKFPGTGATIDTLEAAKDLYGYALQRATMFDYSGASTPLMYRGVVGRLFGQFGTYSAGFRANIAEAMRYGTPAQKAASIATYLGMTSAYYGAFEAMKVRTNDFIPFAPGLFTGGPMFDIGLNMIRATDPGFEGQQARAALKRDLSAVVPGSSQWRYIKRGLERAEAGDVYGTMLSTLMIPMYTE